LRSDRHGRRLDPVRLIWTGFDGTCVLFCVPIFCSAKAGKDRYGKAKTFFTRDSRR
jgi:hypothetical protein